MFFAICLLSCSWVNGIAVISTFVLFLFSSCSLVVYSQSIPEEVEIRSRRVRDLLAPCHPEANLSACHPEQRRLCCTFFVIPNRVVFCLSSRTELFFVCHPEPRRQPSVRDLTSHNMVTVDREIPRFARDDKKNCSYGFGEQLFSLVL